MFRSALRNEDRTKILLYNNPLPDINNDSGTDIIMRFLLPSPMKSLPVCNYSYYYFCIAVTILLW